MTPRGRYRVAVASSVLLWAFLSVSRATAQCSLVVTNTSDFVAGSLRSAITCSNTLSGPNTITFNIPGAGVHLIQPFVGLPTLTTPVTIDGYSQPGSSPNKLASGDNAVLLIQLDGSLNDGNFDGLDVAAANSVVRGLSITHFRLNGINVSASNVTVQGCFIGVAPDGVTAVGNAGVGIRGYLNTVIGGGTPAGRNVISGNGGAGVELVLSNCTVQGNYIGTDATGMGGLGNGGDGILDFGFQDLIGGTTGAMANVIAFNGGAGVNVGCSSGCATEVGILGNSIFSNGGLGITLGGGTSPLPNDHCDADTGPNGQQNYPVLTRAEVQGTTTILEGTLDSVANTSYRVELFVNPACDTSGNGEGQTFLGATIVATGPSCTGSFSLTLPSALSAGQVVTATATDPNDNTSEFSACFPVSIGICSKSAPPPRLIIDSPIAALGSTAALTWDPPFPGFAGSYLILVSTDNGATFSPFGTSPGNQFVFPVQFPVGKTVFFEVEADPGCGPAGVSDPSPRVSLQVVQSCPPVAGPTALVDQTQVPVGNPWSLHWTATLPPGPSGPAGVYEIRISEDLGVSYHVVGTTTDTSFTGPPVPQSDLGKLVFLQVFARPSCSTGSLSGAGSNVVFFQVLPGCEAPRAARNASISAASLDGRPINRPPFPTEPLSLSWDPPTSGTPPTGYFIRINGDTPSFVSGGTGVVARPRGNGNPVTLYVTSVACNPQKQGPEIHSPTVALLTSPPGANFAISPSPRVGQPVTLTDTSNPQATSWLWLFDDGTQQTVQSPAKTFTTPGTHTVALVATNGAGSASSVQSFFVNAASATVTVPPGSETIAFAVSGEGRRRAAVDLEGPGAVWLRLSSTADEETTLFLRFLDETDNLVEERRLVVAQGATVAHDLGAYGLRGSFTVELVGEVSVSATIVRTGRLPREVRR